MAKLEPPTTRESWSTRMIRWGFNLAPVYRGTGAWVTRISADWRDVRVKLPLSLRTRNYVGTIFGGSMYAAVDPFYMIMLIRNLGKGYTVWDKAATIRFRKPGKTTLYARFALDEAELSSIRAELETARSINRVYTVTLTDAQGVVHAEVEKVIYIRRDMRTVGASEREARDTVPSAPRPERVP